MDGIAELFFVFDRWKEDSTIGEKETNWELLSLKGLREDLTMSRDFFISIRLKWITDQSRRILFHWTMKLVFLRFTILNKSLHFNGENLQSNQSTLDQMSFPWKIFSSSSSLIEMKNKEIFPLLITIIDNKMKCPLNDCSFQWTNRSNIEICFDPNTNQFDHWEQISMSWRTKEKMITKKRKRSCFMLDFISLSMRVWEKISLNLVIISFPIVELYFTRWNEDCPTPFAIHWERICHVCNDWEYLLFSLCSLEVWSCPSFCLHSSMSSCRVRLIGSLGLRQ
jgi:hypothetical protein